MNISRRDFLKGGAALAATAAVAGLGVPAFADEEPKAAGYSWETPPAAIPEDQIKETIESDIVIVGAGISGTCAALRASELGASVSIIEKAAFPSGRGGHYGCYQSKAMTAAGLINDDKAQIAADWMRFCGNRNNEKLVHLFLDNSSKVFDWLDDMSGDELSFVPIETHYAGPQYYEHIGTHSIRGSFPDNPGTTAVVYWMWKKAEELGAKFTFNAVAEQLIKEDGRVTAVIVKEEDGYKKYIGNKGIILATGDISGNPEMMEAFCDPIGLKPKVNAYTPAGNNTGDGQRMGMWVGGHMQDSKIPTMIHLIRYCSLCFSTLYVNNLGKRFMNEDTWIQAKSIKILSQSEAAGNEYAWSIFDSNWKDQIRATIPIGGGQFWDNMSRLAGNEWDADNAENIINASINSGDSICADTIEELAAHIGCDAETLKATIDRYNELGDAGEDTDFYKRPALLNPIKEGPFYAVKFGPSLLSAPGGLEVNEKLQVVDDAKEAIPGLYAVGNVSGGRYAVDYPVFINGNSHGSALTWGYLAADNIVNG